MSLVLKSNRSLALSKITDKVSQVPVMYLDFRDGKYILNGETVPDIADIIESSQARSSSYDANLKRTDLPEKTPTVTLDPIAFNKGLLAEAYTGNYFIDSDNPQTQDVYLGAPQVGVGSVAFGYMEGAGSIKIFRLSDNEFLGEVKEGEIFAYRLKPQDVDITLKFRFRVEVVGQVSFVSMFAQAYTNTYPITRTRTGSTVREGSNPTFNKVKESVVRDVIKDNNYTFVIKVVDTAEIWSADYNSQDNNGNPKTYNAFGTASLRDTSTGSGLFMGVGRFNHQKALGRLSIRESSAVELLSKDVIGDTDNYPREVVHAISVSGNKIAWSVNGSAVQVAHETVSIPNEIVLGDVVGWAGIRTYNKLVEQVAVFGEALSDIDLIKLSLPR